VRKSDSNSTDRSLAEGDASLAIGPVALRPPGLNDIEVGVYQRLLDAISERRLAPGLKLNEEELAGIFAVSRERIRRILLVLSQYGIVRLEPNRGASVANPSGVEQRDVFEARRVLERHIIGSLIELDKLQRSFMANELRLHLEKERDAIAKRDRNQQIRLSGEFHLKLAAYAGNQQVLRMLQELVARMSLAMAAHAPAEALSCSISEHAALLDSIEAGEVEVAQKILDGHLRHIEHNLAESMANTSVLHQAFGTH
jgi:DNA-binding GntR family transcriptional regulator